MNYTIYQVDAFAEKIFEGNPAAVCPLKNWIDDTILLQIASENNLSETAFYVIKDNHVEIRWFTPKTEVDLCGHATLAAAFVLKIAEDYRGDIIPFYSPRSGHLPVQIKDDYFQMNFPVDKISEIAVDGQIMNLTNMMPIAAYRGKTDYMLIYDKQEEIELLKPNLTAIERLKARGVIVTAMGNTCDFVSRFFAPQCGVNEDPVTGSAHTTLTPYWAQRLKKRDLQAEQLSARKGKINCRLMDERVEITGKAILYMKGEIYI